MKNKIARLSLVSLAAVCFATSVPVFADQVIQNDADSSNPVQDSGGSVEYDEYGFDEYGFNSDGYDENGRDVNGYDKMGYNKKGYDRKGCTEKDNAKHVELTNQISTAIKLSDLPTSEQDLARLVRLGLDKGYNTKKFDLEAAGLTSQISGATNVKELEALQSQVGTYKLDGAYNTKKFDLEAAGLTSQISGATTVKELEALQSQVGTYKLDGAYNAKEKELKTAGLTSQIAGATTLEALAKLDKVQVGTYKLDGAYNAKEKELKTAATSLKVEQYKQTYPWLKDLSYIGSGVSDDAIIEVCDSLERLKLDYTSNNTVNFKAALTVIMKFSNPKLANPQFVTIKKDFVEVMASINSIKGMETVLAKDEAIAGSLGIEIVADMNKLGLFGGSCTTGLLASLVSNSITKIK
jgi:hypothetical protein